MDKKAEYLEHVESCLRLANQRERGRSRCAPRMAKTWELLADAYEHYAAQLARIKRFR